MNSVQLRRWTREEYDRMVEAGLLTPADRVELIDGEILAVTPQGSSHATAVSLALEALAGALGPGSHVRVQLPLALGADSEPEPDIAVVAGTARDYRDAHPQTALLVVEVADATLAYDRDVKSGLYARSAIRDYWVVNLIDRRVEVYREPVVAPDARFGWRYRTHTGFDPHQHVTPLASPSARVPVADLLP